MSLSRRWLLVACITLIQPWASAHTVPNITVEVELTAEGYELSLNIDPRLFLAANPSALPPLGAGWWLDQTPEEQQAVLVKAAQYVGETLTLRVGGAPCPWPNIVWTAINGEDNTPVNRGGAELHLLGIVTKTHPGAKLSFDLLPKANSSVILFGTVVGRPIRRAQVLFAGESSKVIALPE
jgi:hypothetical protein